MRNSGRRYWLGRWSSRLLSPARSSGRCEFGQRSSPWTTVSMRMRRATGNRPPPRRTGASWRPGTTPRRALSGPLFSSSSRDSVAGPLYDRLSPGLLGAEDLYLMGAAMESARRQEGKRWSLGARCYPTPLTPSPSMHYVVVTSIRNTIISRLWLPSDWPGFRTGRLAPMGCWAASTLPRTTRHLGRLHAGSVLLIVGSRRRAADRWRRFESTWPAPLLRLRQPAQARWQLQAVLSLGPDQEASWLLSRAFFRRAWWLLRSRPFR